MGRQALGWGEEEGPGGPEGLADAGRARVRAESGASATPGEGAEGPRVGGAGRQGREGAESETALAWRGSGLGAGRIADPSEERKRPWEGGKKSRAGPAWS